MQKQITKVEEGTSVRTTLRNGTTVEGKLLSRGEYNRLDDKTTCVIKTGGGLGNRVRVAIKKDEKVEIVD